MKIKKEHLKKQRRILDKKLEPWLKFSQEKKPPIGWIKAIRGALGMTTKQLAQHLGIDQSGVVRHEKREVDGRITLEMLNEIAKSMNCKLVYAIVPAEGFQSLEDILDHQAHKVASTILKKISHTMLLEEQEVDERNKHRQQNHLAHELKENLDSRLWDKE